MSQRTNFIERVAARQSQRAAQSHEFKYEPFTSWPISANALCEVSSGSDAKEKSPA
jgi:hypothetical protein